MTNIDGMVIEYVLRFGFKASNNQAEFKALIAKLKITKDLDVKHLRIFTNLQRSSDNLEENMRPKIQISLDIYRNSDLYK